MQTTKAREELLEAIAKWDAMRQGVKGEHDG